MNLTKYFRLIAYLVATLGVSGAIADSRVDFFRAINIDNVGAVNDLLARGFDPNAANDKGQPALFLALRDEAPRVTAALLAHPQIKVDVENASGETPLMMAALKGNTALVRQLVARGAQVNRPGWTPLHYAATGPEPAIVGYLLERGAKVDAPSPNHSTALMMAARYGAQESAELLLASGADVGLRNDAGQSAADFARLGGREKLAAALERAPR